MLYLRKCITIIAAVICLTAPAAARAATSVSDSLAQAARVAWESSRAPLFSDSNLAADPLMPHAGADAVAVCPDDDIPSSSPLELNPYDRLPTHCPNPSPYALPYSLTGSSHDWRRLWINTGVLTGAFVGTLFVLEMLPEDATSWNRAELQDVPLFKRWRQHVIEDGPEWDHDKFVFNYVLHPYAGAVYFMGARSAGFNFYQSLLYCSIISNIGWEFGIEAFMERPSYQDLFITPIVGSALGESFYKLKRYLVDNDYCLFGSKVVGNIVAFLIDPLNEVVGLFDHNPARGVARAKAWDKKHRQGTTASMQISPAGLSLVVCF